MESIPEQVRRTISDRLDTHASTAWEQQCLRVDVRFRGKYAYISAVESDPWILPNTTPEEKERLSLIHI